MLWDARITANGTLYKRWVIDDILTPLALFLTQSWKDQKQTHTDLLAVQKASKDKIIDTTDYVALGWTVDNSGIIHSV